MASEAMLLTCSNLPCLACKLWVQMKKENHFPPQPMRLLSFQGHFFLEANLMLEQRRRTNNSWRLWILHPPQSLKEAIEGNKSTKASGAKTISGSGFKGFHNSTKHEKRRTKFWWLINHSLLPAGLTDLRYCTCVGLWFCVSKLCWPLLQIIYEIYVGSHNVQSIPETLKPD